MFPERFQFWRYGCSLTFLYFQLAVAAEVNRIDSVHFLPTNSLVIIDGRFGAIVLNAGNGRCQRFYVKQGISSPANRELIHVNSNEFESLSNLCDKMNHDDKAAAELVSRLQERHWAIYPGTKWCGAGNVSSNYNDLGEHAETDACCREHDHCTDYIVSGACHPEHKICNHAPVTRSSCTCDNRFRECLMKSKDAGAEGVGTMFFYYFGLMCFRFDYPIKRCLEYGGFLNWHCQIYEYDVTKPKGWNYYDQPVFSYPKPALFFPSSK